MGPEIPVKEKQIESSELQTGACKYCGQMYQFETSGMVEEEALDAWATEKCDCIDAQEARKKAREREIASTYIDNLFRERYPVAADIMQNALEPLMEREIDEMSINIDGRCKAKIRVSNKGKVKVERIITNKDVRE